MHGCWQDHQNKTRDKWEKFQLISPIFWSLIRADFFFFTVLHLLCPDRYRNATRRAFCSSPGIQDNHPLTAGTPLPPHRAARFGVSDAQKGNVPCKSFMLRERKEVQLRNPTWTFHLLNPGDALIKAKRDWLKCNKHEVC